MKTFGMVTLLAVLASCGGKSDSKSAKGVTLDPITQDKLEESVRSLRPGMVTTETEIGTDFDLNKSAAGKWVVKTKKTKKVEKETILSIIGDDIYTLVESTSIDFGGTSERIVKKESIQGLIRDYSEPLPPGISLKKSGNTITMSGAINSKFEVEPGVNVNMNSKITASISLDDIRCSGINSYSHSGTLSQKSGTIALPNVSSNAVSGCGRSLTAAELKAIDLTSIQLCDESLEDEEENGNCSDHQDLSYLVK